jgi:hypothetical protein
MYWKTKNFDLCEYQFDYDGANRLTDAVYTGTGQIIAQQISAPSAQGDRPHKDFASFQGEGSQQNDSIIQDLSDTEASVGLWAGAACIAPGTQTVENKKSLCSLDFLVLLRQGKSTNTYICPSRSK